MAPRPASPWIVLKFGGTSVSTLANWHNIAHVVRKRLADGDRVLIVHSALSGITDRLENFLRAALAGTHTELLERSPLYREIVEKGLPDSVFLTRKQRERQAAGL